MTDYSKPPELAGGLRLHQNENTGGCSPRVVEALRALDAEQIAYYPAYEAATLAVARHFQVRREQVALTNGLDEGILAVAITKLRPQPDGFVPEAILPEPAFEIYRVDTAVAGGKLVSIAPASDFRLPLDAVLAAITPATRVVFLTNPNNPTGVSMPLDAIRTVARRVPLEAIVFVDEAYAEFAGRSFIPELSSFRNVIVGRTLSKAYGLAGLRIGCLIAAADVLDPIRRAIPVYSVNTAAVVAARAALGDTMHLESYLGQVKESKAVLYTACDRLGLKYWPSDANFVLVRIGDDVADVIAGAAERGVHIRGRSSEPGCDGCVRIATGIVEHTKLCVAALEEALASIRSARSGA